MPTEQEVLSNTLKSPTEGGSASGILGAGADVPEVLAENPATRQLLQESVYTQTGQTDKAVASSETYNATKPAPSVVTSELADTRNTENQTTLNNYETQLQNTNSTGTTTTKTPAPTAPAEDADPLQTKIDSAVSALDTEYNQAAGMLDSRMASLDAANQAAVENIKRVFAVRREEAKLLNSQLMGTVTKAGIRSGRQRYASEINAGILTDQEQQGLARLSQLDAAELQLISEAKAANDGEQFSLLSKKLDLISQTRREKDQAIKDLNKAAMEAEAAALEKAKTMREFAKYDREDASASVDAMVKAGLDPASVSQDYLNQLDIQAGYIPGTSKGLMEMGIKERSIKDSKDINDLKTAQIEQASKLVGLLQEMPVGESITIDGVDYRSLNKGETITGSEDDGKGNTTIWSYNKDTGDYSTRVLEGVSKVDGWEFETKNGVGLFVNPNTNEVRVAFDANQPDNGVPNPTVLKEQFPNNWKPTEADMQALGLSQLNPKTGGVQCGQMTRVWSNYSGPSLTSFEAKKALIEKGIGTDANPPQAGDAFIQSGGTYGHIGMVLGSTKLPDGSYDVQVIDANSKGDGVIRYHSINSKSILGFAREKFGFKPEYQFGTDSPSMDQEAALQRYGDTNSSISVPQQAELRSSITKDKAIVQYQDLTSTFNSMRSIADTALTKPTEESRASLDQALVTLFNKMLDPTSVVREGEYARTAEGQSAMSRAQGYIAQVQQGGAGITDGTRQDMVEVAELLKGSAAESYQQSVDYWVPVLEQYDLDPNLFIKGYGSEIESEPVATVDALIKQYPAYSADIQQLINEGISLDEIKEALSGL